MTLYVESAQVSSHASKAYMSIKREIISCRLEPGAQVSEAQLVERHAAGRTGVRAALNRLLQERLVQVIPREGWVIAPITLKHVHDLFGARLLVEPATTRMAAGRLTADQLLRLEQLNDVHYIKGDRESTETFLQANTEFHSIIAHGTGNERIASMVISVLDDMERLLNLSHMQYDRNNQSFREHDELIDALRVGDGERAAQVAIAHIEPMKTLVTEVLISHPSLQSINLATIRSS